MSSDGYAMVTPQQVRNSGMLSEVRRERQTARAIFKATIRVDSEVGSDVTSVYMPADL